MTWLVLPVKQRRDCALLVPWHSQLDWCDFETDSKLGFVLSKPHIS